MTFMSNSLGPKVLSIVPGLGFVDQSLSGDRRLRKDGNNNKLFDRILDLLALLEKLLEKRLGFRIQDFSHLYTT